MADNIQAWFRQMADAIGQDPADKVPQDPSASNRE
jgi:hypothetical protein